MTKRCPALPRTQSDDAVFYGDGRGQGSRAKAGAPIIDGNGLSPRGLCRLQDQRELALVFHDQLVTRRQKLENGHHRLAQPFADPLAIALDQFQANGQRVGILAGGSQGLGQGELEREVIGTRRQRGPRRPRRRQSLSPGPGRSTRP